MKMKLEKIFMQLVFHWHKCSPPSKQRKIFNHNIVKASRSFVQKISHNVEIWNKKLTQEKHQQQQLEHKFRTKIECQLTGDC